MGPRDESRRKEVRGGVNGLRTCARVLSVLKSFGAAVCRRILKSTPKGFRYPAVDVREWGDPCVASGMTVCERVYLVTTIGLWSIMESQVYFVGHSSRSEI